MKYRTRGDDITDVRPRHVLRTFAVAAGAVCCAALVVILCALAAISDTIKSTKYTNQLIDQFNELPQSDREAIIHWDDYHDYDPETFLRQHHEVPSLLPPITVGGVVLTIVIALCVLSLCLSFAYFAESYRQYHFYDLPSGTYGRTLFFLMFAGWPFMLLSYLTVLLDHAIKKWQAEQEERTRQEAEARRQTERQAQAARTGTPSQSDSRGIEEGIASSEPVFAPTARRQPELVEPTESAENFIRFVSTEAYDTYADRHAESVRYAKQNVDMKRLHTQELSQQLSQAQAALSEAEAELTQLESQPTLTREQSQQKAARDWEIIRHLKGVYAVTHCLSQLYVYTRVVVPYEDHYYDFGDYRITISTTGLFHCRSVRSGQRNDWLDLRFDGNAVYESGSGFCFGNSRDTIREYIYAGRFAEALTLILNCLHWVNPEDRQAIPIQFYAIDPTIDPIVDNYFDHEEG